MYEWVVNMIGSIPSGNEWIYTISTLGLYIVFLIMLCSPVIILLNIYKNKRRR